MRPLTRRLVAMGFAVGTALQAQEPNAFRDLAQRLVAVGWGPDLVATPAARSALAQLYDGRDRPLWSRDGVPTRQALASVDLLATTDTRGLPPSRYGFDSLGVLAGRVSTSLTDAVQFDVVLSRAMIQLLSDLHRGRIDPESVRFHLPETHEGLDLAALTAEAASAENVVATIAAAEPPYVAYATLKDALVRYRRLAADPGLRPPPRTSHPIRLGDSYPGAPALRRLLRALGDLQSASESDGVSPGDTAAYDSVLVAGVVRFQHRHGLDPDGVIGRATMAQLETPLTRRVRQIELALERWRWLPDRPPSRYAVVNIPAFRLYVFESDSAGERPALAMNVIVGEWRGGRATPVFTAVMREVVFRPYWDVPPRIARNELIPQFRRRPSSFVKEGFEIVRVGDGGDRATVFPLTARNLDRVAAGSLRLRQRPGPQNALGAVKFVFPNPYNVFMHGTPAQELFAHTRRDFSHGCIRIERPNELAELVLRGQGPWTGPSIDAAMNGTRTLHVALARPVAVYVLYTTAVVDADGVLRFYPDLYGHDAVLEQALELSSAP